MPKKVTFRNEKILDSWSVLIEDAQGKADEIYSSVLKFLQESKIPDVKTETVTGVVPGFFGPKGHRDYLMAKNERLKDYRMYVGARDYGKNLNVSWYLTCEPGPLKRMVSGALTGYAKGLSFSLDVFQLEDLTAYVTSVHHRVLKAVDSVMRESGQDPSKIDRKSRGFLGVS